MDKLSLFYLDIGAGTGEYGGGFRLVVVRFVQREQLVQVIRLEES